MLRTDTSVRERPEEFMTSEHERTVLEAVEEKLFSKLPLDRLIHGRSQNDVKRITSVRRNELTGESEYFTEWMGDLDTLFAM